MAPGDAGVVLFMARCPSRTASESPSSRNSQISAGTLKMNRGRLTWHSVDLSRKGINSSFYLQLSTLGDNVIVRVTPYFI